MDKNYEGIIDKVVDISKTSTKDNSIIYQFFIKENYVDSTISVIERSGEKKVIRKDKIYLEGKFYRFITPLLKKFTDSNKIIHNDFVDMNKDNIVAYRLITENNDQFTVDGLTFEDAYYIRDIVSTLKVNNTEVPKVLKLTNNKGATNPYLIIFIIVVVIVVAACLSIFI